MKKLYHLLFLIIVFFQVSFAQEFELGLPLGNKLPNHTAIFSSKGDYIVTASSNSILLWDRKTGRLLRSYDGHERRVRLVKLSYDEKYIISGSDDKTIKIWDLKSGEIIHSLEGHSEEVNYFSLSQDSKLLVSAGYDNMAILWDFYTGKKIKVFVGHIVQDIYKGIYTVCFSPDDSKIVTASADKTAVIWDVKTGAPIFTLQGHKDRLKSAKFTTDGNYVITASKLDGAKLWDVNTGNLAYSFEEYKYGIKAIELNPKGDSFVAYGEYDPVIWDLKSRKLVYTLKGHEQKVNSARFSSNGDLIATGSSDETIIIWNVKTGKIINRIKAHASGVSSVDFSPNNDFIVSTGYDYTTKVWEVKNGKLVKVIKAQNEKIGEIKILNNNSFITSSNDTNSIKLWDLQTGNLNQSFNDHTQLIESTELNFEEGILLTSSWDGTANLWDINTGDILHKFKGNSYKPPNIKLSSDGKYLAFLKDGNLDIWSVDELRLIHIIKDSNDKLTSFKFSQDNKLVVTYSENNIVKLWGLSSGIHLKTFTDPNDKIKFFKICPNNKYLVTTNEFNSVKLWDVLTGKKLSQLYHGDSVFDAVFTKNSELLITCSSDKTNRIWDLQTGELKKIFMVKSNRLGIFKSIEVSQDNGLMVNGFFEDTLKIVDLKKGIIKNELAGHKDYIYTAKFNPDNKSILTLSNDNTVKIWNLKTGEIIRDLNINSQLISDIDFNMNGSLIIATLNEGTIILFDGKSGKKIVKQANLNEDNIWLLPNGYYMASKEAASKLYYKDGLETIGFEQLDVKYNRPDKILEVLGDISGKRNDQLINAYKKAWEKRIRKLDIDTTSFRKGFSVPESEFYNRDNITYEQSQSELKLRIKGFDNTYKLDRFNVWINEVPVYGRKGISLKSRNTKAIDTTLTVMLSKGENRIETSILNVNGIESYRQPLYVNYAPKKEIKEKLYFVGIGVDKYQEEGNDLNYSVKDIKDLSIQLKEKYGRQIQIDTLFNQNVTVSNIKKLKDRLKSSKVDDKVIISFSGHGLLSKDLDYYLATHNVNFSFPEENGLPFEDLEYLLDGIPSRQKLLLIDACHSGEVDKEEVESIHEVEKLKEGLKGSIGVRTKKPKMGMKNSFELMKELFNNVDRATGATVISAAAGTEFAQERGNLKNGVFTYCILNQLKEKKSISVSELKQLVSEQVKEITNGLQQPTSRNETIENDWYVW